MANHIDRRELPWEPVRSVRAALVPVEAVPEPEDEGGAERGRLQELDHRDIVIGPRVRAPADAGPAR